MIEAKFAFSSVETIRTRGTMGAALFQAAFGEAIAEQSEGYPCSVPDLLRAVLHRCADRQTDSTHAKAVLSIEAPHSPATAPSPSSSCALRAVVCCLTSSESLLVHDSIPALAASNALTRLERVQTVAFCATQQRGTQRDQRCAPFLSTPRASIRIAPLPRARLATDVRK